MIPKSNTIRTNILLLISAMIWGFAFVAQRKGMEHVDPFVFNAVRFALGAFSLLPLMFFMKHRQKKVSVNFPTVSTRLKLFGGCAAGLALFCGSSLQQYGIVYTTAGKAGFITGLYMIIVPIMGIVLNQRTTRNTWLGVFIALFGLYLLSIKQNFIMSVGDLLVLCSAFFWALHVQIIGWFTDKMNSLQLAFMQFCVCSILSCAVSLIIETTTMEQLCAAAIPILYAGLMSTGVAYTLQVVAQQKSKPSHAAIILSSEAVFAVIGGWLLLNELMTIKALIGCGLMLLGMVLSQIKVKHKN